MDGVAASSSGVQAAMQSMATSANNLANSNTDGYRAQTVAQEAQPQGGVRDSLVLHSPAQPVPGGSNVDPATEAVNLDTQGAGYQANLQAASAQQQMLGSALDLQA
jgi:flagellar hook protein FlgE